MKALPPQSVPKKETTQEDLPKRKKLKVSATNFLAIIHFDGGARGNPGTAGSGAQVVFIKERCPDQKRIFSLRKYIVKATNNVAEYQGLLIGLRKTYSELERFISADKGCSTVIEVKIKGDSQIIIMQLQGNYKCKAENLKPFYKEAKSIISDIEKKYDAHFSFQHVYRKDNVVADRLANEAMDQRRSWDTEEDTVQDASLEDNAQALDFRRKSRIVRKADV